MKKLFGAFCALLSLCFAFGCASQKSQAPEGYAVVHFNTQTDMETNVINDQTVKIGSFAKEPSVICPKNLDTKTKISGWYKESSYKNKWNFTTNPVTGDMTLYAKWVDMISISYYLKGSDSPIWVVNNASCDEPLELHDELCDGYEFYGYFSDKDCTIPFDLEKPLKEDTVVYMHRGETLHLNADSIKRRFTMMAAGGSGSTAGNISDVKLDPSGLSCVDVNFGYSTSADPYMLITNPQIDISKSQKIKIKFKNFGACTNLAFYWVSQYEDGSYAANYRYDSEANSLHYTLNGYECFMTENDPWIEREFDLSEKFTNGISTWGNSVTLVRLRIQFGYISRNHNDTSNIIRIASIDAISDDKNIGFKDSAAVSKMLVNDSNEDIQEASSHQTQNIGVIFPKNIDVVSNISSTYYVKKEGLLLYAKYGSDISRYFFDISNQSIDASLFSYLSIRLKNYSYISSMNVYINTLDPDTGRTLSNVITTPISIRMNRFGVVDLNFYSKSNMKGIIQSFSILFNYNGVDNAILLESMTIKENRSLQVPGFNFNDPNNAGFTDNEDVDISLNKTMSTTTFVTNKTSSIISYELDYTLDITPYSYIDFSYYKLKDGINSLIIGIKINDEWKTYPLELGDISSELVNVRYDLLDAGVVQAIRFTFDNAGELEIQALKFVLDESISWDVSDSNVFSKMLSDWAEPISYIEDQQAALYNNPSEGIRYYFGFLYSYGYRNYGNICLENKTSIYLIYKNLNNYGTPFISLFAADSTTEQEYLTSFNERTAFISNRSIAIDKNMDERSWKVAKIDIPSNYAKSNYYLSNFFLGSVENGELEYYIRGIAVK